MSEIFRDYTQHLTRGIRRVSCGVAVVLQLNQTDKTPFFPHSNAHCVLMHIAACNLALRFRARFLWKRTGNSMENDHGCLNSFYKREYEEKVPFYSDIHK